MNTTSHSEQIEKVADLIEDIRIAFLTTVASDGTLHSRPMATQRDRFDGTLYFFTYADSEKVRETDQQRRVAVTFADPSSNTYVALTGNAHTLRDKAKAEELWHPFLKTWFPQGLEDPNLALLHVHVDHAEYWDSPSSTFIHLYGLAKSTLTGRPPQPGDHQSFDVPSRSTH
jgi:general stress protein 26